MRISKHQKLPLFPTMVWVYELENLSDYYDAWIKYIDDQRQAEDEAKGRSTRNGWSGPKTLFQNADFKPLFDSAHKLFCLAFKDMGVIEGFRFRMEGWANVHDKNGFNHAHIHREAALSGCFYLSAPEGSGTICFHDPRPATLYTRPLGNGVNKWEKICIKPKAGLFIIFPSWLEHSVELNESDENRYSIALNAISAS